ncbi:GGDEF domain-containing protein [Cytobacillus gottheilii]|uniref:GGDEF domain-containing protein n=1 Tax=Cytobacillus gottheilii TaxID=859144 RepID=UPI00082EFF7A|nr:GGDEF domain-containing protein [Cytobacillus gottheilii]
MKKIFPFPVQEVTEDKKRLLKKHLLMDNIKRCKLFAKIVILFETILILMHMYSSYTNSGTVFVIDAYIILYLLLWSFSILMVIYITIYERSSNHSERKTKLFQNGLWLFVIFFLTWGALVTLVDQRNYGHVMAFAVNFMCVSVLFHASNKTILYLYSLPVAVLYIGLPYAQSSGEIVSGHYINLSVFLFFCWLASRMLYTSYSSNFYQRLLLTEMNENLGLKVEENEKIYKELASANNQLKQLSVMDELTLILNRRGFRQYVQNEFENIQVKRPFAVLMGDIDSFKNYNDHYGHLEGDQVIATVAGVFRTHLNEESSILARFGGEEFVAVLFDVGLDEAFAKAEKVRQAIERLMIPHEYSSAANHITLSIGVTAGKAQYPDEIFQLIGDADKALYEAKASGRNKVKIRIKK